MRRRNETDIYVIGVDLMCFWVDAETLEPRSVGCFDPWAYKDPPTTNVMCVNQWSLQKASGRNTNPTR